MCYLTGNTPGCFKPLRTCEFFLQAFFYVFLDFDNNISEVDESNNQALLQVRIKNGRVTDKSVTCPSSPKDLKTDVQVRLLSDSWRFKEKYNV